MNRIIVLMLLALGVVAYRHQFGPIQGASVASGGNPCADKKFCAIVYVAPWCPACRSIEPQLKTFLHKSQANRDYGMQVVVGQGRARGDNEKNAAEYGPQAITDNDSTIFKKFGVDKFPSFYIVDREGSVILQDMEAYQWLHEKLL